MTTLACGVGHILSSVVIGAIGIAAGLAVGGLEVFEDGRGQVAGWLLLGFGLAYFVCCVRRAIRNQPHMHLHRHADGVVHSHPHGHTGDHVHVHTRDCEPSGSMASWVLFTILVFGPCEPLIPILTFPAAKLSLWGAVLATLVFGICTLATMTTVVVAGYLGLSRISFSGLARYSHAVAGCVIAPWGAAIQLGL